MPFQNHILIISRSPRTCPSIIRRRWPILFFFIGNSRVNVFLHALKLLLRELAFRVARPEHVQRRMMSGRSAVGGWLSHKPDNTCDDESPEREHSNKPDKMKWPKVTAIISPVVHHINS